MPNSLELAAENARLRAALKGIRTVLSGAAPIDRGIALLHRDREEIEQHLAALAAAPGPLVAAVEGLVGALELSLVNLHAVRISERHAPNAKTAERYSFTNEVDADEVEAAIDQMTAALAAYRAALGGNNGPR